MANLFPAVHPLHCVVFITQSTLEVSLQRLIYLSGQQKKECCHSRGSWDFQGLHVELASFKEDCIKFSLVASCWSATSGHWT